MIKYNLNEVILIKYIKYILWLLVIIMLVIMFSFSNMNSDNSNGTSKRIIKDTVIFINKTLNKDISDEHINNIVNKLNYPIRKLCHFSEYFILCLLLLLAFKYTNIKLNKSIIISIILIFIFSLTDEYHQLFIDGRSPLFTDCLIDTSGAITCSIIFKIINIIRSKYHG